MLKFYNGRQVLPPTKTHNGRISDAGLTKEWQISTPRRFWQDYDETPRYRGTVVSHQIVLHFIIYSLLFPLLNVSSLRVPALA